MTLNKFTKKQALESAQASGLITVSDRDFGWQDKPVTFDEMIDLLNEYGKTWNAHQYEGANFMYIDTRSRMHFEVIL